MKVLGIGNALVDILTQLNNDQILERFQLPRGSMTLVNLEMSNQILKETSGLPRKRTSGGSAANTIHGLAHMGLNTAFIGKIGDDELGEFFNTDMQVNHIRPVLYNSATHTGRAVTLISQDSERTFATYLGAAVELSAEDLTPDIFMEYDLLYAEGYLVLDRETITRAMELASSAGLRICLDLSSYNVVRDNADYLRNLLERYVDIVFANEEEARALTGHSPVKAVEMMSEICDIAVVKTGSEGSIIKQHKNIIKIDAEKANPVDTTGAGDLYASGFIYGLSQNASLHDCGRIGSILASRVIEILGAKMDEPTWDILKKYIEGEIICP